MLKRPDNQKLTTTEDSARGTTATTHKQQSTASSTLTQQSYHHAVQLFHRRYLLGTSYQCWIPHLGQTLGPAAQPPRKEWEPIQSQPATATWFRQHNSSLIPGSPERNPLCPSRCSCLCLCISVSAWCSASHHWQSWHRQPRQVFVGDFYADHGQVVDLNAIKIFDNEHGGQGYTLVWIWPDAPAREVIVMDNWMFGVFPQIPLILFNCWDPTTTSTTNNDSSEINSTRLPQLR